ESLDELRVLLGDETAAHLPRAGQLSVVGVELLVENQEPANLRAGELRIGREIPVRLLDAVLNEVRDRVLSGEVRVAAVGEITPLGPIAHGRQVDVDEGGGVVPPVSVGDSLLDVRKKLQLVLEILGREERAVLEAADILGPIDDLQVAILVEETGIPSVDPAVFGLSGGCGLRVLEVRAEDSRAAEEHFAVLRDPNLDVLDRRTDRVRLDAAVGLHADED